MLVALPTSAVVVEAGAAWPTAAVAGPTAVGGGGSLAAAAAAGGPTAHQGDPFELASCGLARTVDRNTATETETRIGPGGQDQWLETTGKRPTTKKTQRNSGTLPRLFRFKAPHVS